MNIEDMPQPQIKRYALVPEGDGRARGDRSDAVPSMRRFHLARVAPSSRSALGVDRLERMEEIAAMDRAHENGSSNQPVQRGERTSIASSDAAPASRRS